MAILLVTGSVRQSQSGTAVGFLNTLFGIGYAIGPLVGGIAADIIGTNAPYYSSGLSFCIIITLVLLSVRGLEVKTKKS